MTANGFVSSQDVLNFECHFFTSAWVVIDVQYACKAQVSYIFGGRNLTTVIGIHETGRNNSDVKMLLVHDQMQLKSIPGNMEKFFPNLYGLEFLNGNIETVTAADLKPFPDLKLLNLGFQKLVVLESDLLQDTPKLEWINFSSNLLKVIGSGLLTGLSELSTAFFLRNPCVSLQSLSHETMPNLQLLLSENCPFDEKTTVTILPSTSTTPQSDECSAGCLEKIDSVESEFEAKTHELNDKIADQGKRIEDLIELNENQTKQVENLIKESVAYEARLLELEKQMREINANPRLR